ncbi:MAG: PH domain-containing protein [Luteimonas sp.]|nr:PH domain-containing protein [Luteimonas sp.]
MESPAPWQLQPASSTTRLWLWLLAVALPLAIIGGALAFTANDTGAKQLIGDSVWLTNALVVFGTLAITFAVHWFIARALRRHSVAVDGDGLAITTTFYTRELGWSELQLPQARVVDLDEHTEFKPMLKTNGTSLPGFRSGWFRLRNRHKALVAMASGPRVLHLPTTKGYDLLLQPRQPQALLQRLQELAPATVRR